MSQNHRATPPPKTSDNHSESHNDKQLLGTVEKLVRVQERNLEIKTKELELEHESIRSNEKIALATIEAQKSDRNQQMQVVGKIELFKYISVGLIICCVTGIIIYAMYSNNTEFAIEFIKIGGGVLVGYIAGFSRGKLKSVENKNED